MAERPILFSAPMVQAILEGRKTQTRRIVKPMPGLQSAWLSQETLNSVPHGGMSGGGWQMHHPRAGTHHMGVDVEHNSPFGWIRCPYGVPGDRLWVRETWGSADQFYQSHENETPSVVAYRADLAAIQWDAEPPRKIPKYDLEQWNWDTIRWRPSIHMPRWASRLTLEVVSVRVERLRDIGEDDARAEGLEGITKDGGLTIKYGIPDRDGFPGTDDLGWPWRDWDADPRKACRTLWEHINGAGSWDANPWVWVVEFKVLA